MKVIERTTEQSLGGAGLTTIRMVRVIEVPEGTKLKDGQVKATPDTETHDWKPEEEI